MSEIAVLDNFHCGDFPFYCDVVVSSCTSAPVLDQQDLCCFTSYQTHFCHIGLLGQYQLAKFPVAKKT